MELKVTGDNYAIQVRTIGNLPPHVVDKVFVPIASDRAPNGALLFEVKNVPGKIGYWAVLFNKELLAERDPTFADTPEYYRSLITDGRVTFDFLQEKNVMFTVLGLKDDGNGNAATT